MKFLQVLLIVILVIIAVPLIGALFIKKDYAINRSIVVHRPSTQVYDYLRLLKNQDQFSKWNRMDPAMKKAYNGTDGTVGFMYAWDSQTKAGKGTQKIKALTPNKEVNMEVAFEKPFKNTMQASFLTEPVADNQTQVTWAIKGRNSYPMNFMNLFIGSMLGKDVDSSLATLKSNLEHQ